MWKAEECVVTEFERCGRLEGIEWWEFGGYEMCGSTEWREFGGTGVEKGILHATEPKEGSRVSGSLNTPHIKPDFSGIFYLGLTSYTETR